MALLLGAVFAGGQATAQAPVPDSWAHSCFVYRDVNRSGIYDLGDRPYGGLSLEVALPDGAIALQSSNVDGFANLAVSRGDRENAIVYEPGDYQVTAKMPDGWISTSDKDRQVLTFVQKSNAGGGLVPIETCAAIGVAPILSVSGRYVPPEGSDHDDISISAVSEQGEMATVETSGDGRFRIAGDPGRWLVKVRDDRSGRSVARVVTLARSAVILSSIRFGQDYEESEGSEIEQIGFDDLVSTNSLIEIPSGYGGLNWKIWIAVHNRFYGGPGYVNATMSSDYVAYNSSGAPAVMWSDEPFDFIGVHVGAAWPRGGEEDMIVKAWRGDELRHEERFRVSDRGVVYFDAMFAGVSRVEFSSGNYERIVIDDLRIRKTPPTRSGE